MVDLDLDAQLTNLGVTTPVLNMEVSLPAVECDDTNKKIFEYYTSTAQLVHNKKKRQ